MALQQDERIRQTLEKIFSAHCDVIEAALMRAQQAQEIPPGDTRQRARKISALLEGGLLLAKAPNNPQVFRIVTSAVVGIAAT